jgi:hypothetical protein
MAVIAAAILFVVGTVLWHDRLPLDRWRGCATALRFSRRQCRLYIARPLSWP